MGSHRQGCSQVSGHVKEKKSKHHVMCRQTCVFPNLNKTCACLCPPCLPTCTWMCMSHFFLFFSLIFLFASCPCMLAPGSTCPCLHPPVPGFLCLPPPADLHLTTPGHTCYGHPCLPACTMSLVSGFSFLLYSCAYICNPPTSLSPCPVPAALCVHACQPAHTCLSLCPALHPPACLHPTPANLHLTTPDHTCCGCPCLAASPMSLVSSCFSFYFIFVFTFPIHLCPCPCACACLHSCL